MKRLFSLILVGMLAVSGLSAKVKLSVLYVGGTATWIRCSWPPVVSIP